MAWRSPRFGILHAARDAGAAGVTGANAFSTTQTKDHLLDDRAGTLTTFAATASDHYIQVDRGAAGLEAIDRLWIPLGHNFSGWDVQLASSTTGAFAGEETQRINHATTYTVGGAGGLSVPATQLDFTFTSSDDRYWRMDWPNEVTINPALGELLLTRTRSTVRGPEPGWSDNIEANVQTTALASGVRPVLVNGADNASYAFNYRAVDDVTDQAIFDLLVTTGLNNPILLDPPYDTNTSVWVQVVESSRVQDESVPATTDAKTPRYQFRFLGHTW